MSEILWENLNQANWGDEKTNYLLNLVYKENGVALDEALAIVSRSLRITRLEALTVYLRCKHGGLVKVQLDRVDGDFKPILTLSQRGLREVHRLQAIATLGGEAYEVE